MQLVFKAELLLPGSQPELQLWASPAGAPGAWRRAGETACCCWRRRWPRRRLPPRLGARAASCARTPVAGTARTRRPPGPRCPSAGWSRWTCPAHKPLQARHREDKQSNSPSSRCRRPGGTHRQGLRQARHEGGAPVAQLLEQALHAGPGPGPAPAPAPAPALATYTSAGSELGGTPGPPPAGMPGSTGGRGGFPGGRGRAEQGRQGGGVVAARWWGTAEQWWSARERWHPPLCPALLLLPLLSSHPALIII